VSLSAACQPVFSAAELGEPANPREEARAIAEAYDRTAHKVAELPESFRTRERAARRGIEVVDVLREAAARAQPGAPDFREPTIGMEVRVPGGDKPLAAVLAPVFRHPLAAPLEVRLDRFFLRVGNQHGEPLRTVPLGPFLSDLGRYVTSPASLTGTASLGERVSLVSPRDSRVYVDVQAAIIPVPLRGRASVRPVVFASGAAPRSPALLAVVASREGTSVHVIENRPEDRSISGVGQALDFNEGGDRQAFAIGGRSVQTILVVQVPLASGHIEVHGDATSKVPVSAPLPAPGNDGEPRGAPVSGGPFVEGYGDRIERDESRVLRATVLLLYPVTDSDLSDSDWESIAGRLRAMASRPESAGTALLPDSDARR
jgi:hypothetical protein